MPGTSRSVDYKPAPSAYKSAFLPAQGSGQSQSPAPAKTCNQSTSAPVDDRSAVGEFLQLLARAVHQFRTYPPTNRLCTNAIAACHKAFTSLDQRERLAFRVTPRELLVDEVGIGAGTIVEQELARRLHRARVAAIDIDRTASVRDFARFCTAVARCSDLAETKTTILELLAEHGIETIVPRLAPRPEVLQVGTPRPELAQLVDHERRRRQSTSATTGPASHLYPPDKGWVRLDPSAKLDAVSLVDLAVMIDDPAEIATMLLRLTDDDQVGPGARDAALQQKFSDVAMLFASLDSRLARIMFGKLARAVLALEPERRHDLLRRTILPGLLDGRADGTVLHDFPDLDLAESLCLLLDLETAAPEVVTTALDRLGLPAERRDAVAPLLKAQLQARRAGKQTGEPASDALIDRYARRLMRIGGAARSFEEFAAFDLSIDDRAAAAIAQAGDTIAATDVVVTQLECLWRLVRLEPNPAAVARFLDRAAVLLGELEHAKRWQGVADWATRFHELGDRLGESRPDVAAAISNQLAAFCTADRVTALAVLSESGAAGRQIAESLLQAFGGAIVPRMAAALDDAAFQPLVAPLVPLMCTHARLLAPEVAVQLSRCGVSATRVMVKILGFAGAGYEGAIAAHMTDDDQQVVREALRALARIGSTHAATIVTLLLQNADAPTCAAAEEALWHFPPAQIRTQLRQLLGQRDFVLRHPQMASRLLDRAGHVGADGLNSTLAELESLRFRFWSPAVARVGLKARGLLAQ